MGLPQFSSLLQDWGQSVNLKAFTSTKRKPKKKKPFPALRPTPSPCLHGPAASREKEISGFPQQMSQISRLAKAHSELILLLFDCPKRAEETWCQKTR